MKLQVLSNSTLKLIFSVSLLSAVGLNASAAENAVGDTESLVKWRNLQLTREDFEGDLLRMPEDKRGEFRQDVKRISGELENLLVYRTLAAEARAMGIDQEAAVRKSIELTTERVLGTERLNRFRAQVQAPDMTQAAKEKYLADQSKFLEAEKVHVAHILVDAKTRTDEEARLLAESVREKAVLGADFGQLAQEYSDDAGTKSIQGDLGMFGKGRMVPQFEQAAFALTKAGEISAVVKTRFGYHILRLVDRKPARLKSFEEVRDVLVRELKDKFVTDRVKEYLSDIRNDKSIKMNTGAIDALVINAKAVPSTPANTGVDSGR